ncbi:protein TMED8 [Bufo gargarizans]|uniref:protein TMED8 n=1 Tax=Bufo gargarizans TaxID=30331 RepID=UPI001CF19669|nr:protein TMED8 [Bufo gargarizans]
MAVAQDAATVSGGLPAADSADTRPGDGASVKTEHESKSGESAFHPQRSTHLESTPAERSSRTEEEAGGTPPFKDDLGAATGDAGQTTAGSAATDATKTTAVSAATDATKTTGGSAANDATKTTAVSAATKTTEGSAATDATKTTAVSAATDAAKTTAVSAATNATKTTGGSAATDATKTTAVSLATKTTGGSAATDATKTTAVSAVTDATKTTGGSAATDATKTTVGSAATDATKTTAVSAATKTTAVNAATDTTETTAGNTSVKTTKMTLSKPPETTKTALDKELEALLSLGPADPPPPDILMIQSEQNGTMDIVKADPSLEEPTMTDSKGPPPPLRPATTWTSANLREFKHRMASEKHGLLTIRRGEVLTVRVPTHPDGKRLCWEFATEDYDIGFGIYFDWTPVTSTAVTLQVSESSDEEEEEEAESPWHSREGDVERGSVYRLRSRYGEIMQVFRRDSHREVQAGSHEYPGEGVYLLKLDNSYSLLRNKTLYFHVYYSS